MAKVRRDRIIHVRVTQHVYKWIEEDAAKAEGPYGDGVTVSQWLRQLIRKEIASRQEPL